MSYLVLDDGVPNFKRIVISIWFRVPQASIDAAVAAQSADSSNLLPVIPLVVMGKSGHGNPGVTINNDPRVSGTTTGYNAEGLDQIETTEDIGPCPIPIPLFGEQYKQTIDYNLNLNFVEGTDTEYVRFPTFVPTGPASPTPPSFIGVVCSAPPASGNGGGNGGGGKSSSGNGGSAANTASLYINFETNMQPTISGFAFNKTVTPGSEMSIASTNLPINQGTRVTTYCLQGLTGIYNVEEVSDTVVPVPFPDGTETGPPVYGWDDVTDMLRSTTGSIYADQLPVTADTWHHVLVSLDLKSTATHGSDAPSARAATSADHGSSKDTIELPPIDVTPPDGGGGGGNGGSGGGGGNGSGGGISQYVDSSSTLFVAFDDVNKNANDMGGSWIGEGDPNAVIPDEAYNFAGLATSVDPDTGEPMGGTPSYSLPDPTVPSGEAPLGIPATAAYADSIRQVQMAEFLMWVDYEGDTFDTSVEENRRLFITAPDKHGRQHPTNGSPIYIPINKEAIGDPATWVPGADTPAFIPPLSSGDPSMIPSGNKILKTPNVDFSKCAFNWQMGLNLGKTKGKFHKVGKIKVYWPPEGSDPALAAGSSGGTPGA